MKKILAAGLLLAALVMMLCGCGPIVVEDSQHVEIGLSNPEQD